MTPDWLITKITDRGVGEWYRFRVEGENLNCPEGTYGHTFTWQVPAVCDRRYAAHPDALAEVRIALELAKEHHRFCEHEAV